MYCYWNTEGDLTSLLSIHRWYCKQEKTRLKKAFTLYYSTVNFTVVQYCGGFLWDFSEENTKKVTVCNATQLVNQVHTTVRIVSIDECTP